VYATTIAVCDDDMSEEANSFLIRIEDAEHETDVTVRHDPTTVSIRLMSLPCDHEIAASTNHRHESHCRNSTPVLLDNIP
jgi:hypothetical protein